MLHRIIATKDANKANINRFVGFLVENDVIDKSESSVIKNKYSSVAAAISGLILAGADKVKLARAYSQFAGIPYIELGPVNPEVGKIIDIDSAKRFGFVPFQYDESSRVLQVAFFDLEKLADLDKQAIARLQDKFNIKFEFFITAGVARADGQTEVEFVNLEGLDVDEAILRKMPYDLARKFQAVIYSKEGDRRYKLAANCLLVY